MLHFLFYFLKRHIFFLLKITKLPEFVVESIFCSWVGISDPKVKKQPYNLYYDHVSALFVCIKHNGYQRKPHINKNHIKKTKEKIY